MRKFTADVNPLKLMDQFIRKYIWSINIYLTLQMVCCLLFSWFSVHLLQ